MCGPQNLSSIKRTSTSPGWTRTMTQCVSGSTIMVSPPSCIPCDTALPKRVLHCKYALELELPVPHIQSLLLQEPFPTDSPAPHKIFMEQLRIIIYLNFSSSFLLKSLCFSPFCKYVLAEVDDESWLVGREPTISGDLLNRSVMAVTLKDPGLVSPLRDSCNESMG